MVTPSDDIQAEGGSLVRQMLRFRISPTGSFTGRAVTCEPSVNR